MKSNKWAAAGLLAAFALTLAACGGKSDSSAGAGSSPEASASQELVVKASNWKYDQATYTIPKDTPVRITLENDQGAHGLAIDKAGVKLDSGHPSKVVSLPAGEYDMYCSVICGTGHAQMKAKLIVQ
jgi:cytochrome c oxidase subunit 2